MTQRTIYPNTRIGIKALFFDEDGVLTSPTTVTGEAISPTGVTTSASPTEISTGVYTYTFKVTESGIWSFNMLATGSVELQLQQDVKVEASRHD
jgi:hypothetical protein